MAQHQNEAANVGRICKQKQAAPLETLHEAIPCVTVPLKT